MSIAFSPLAYGQLHRSHPGGGAGGASYMPLGSSLFPGSSTTAGIGASLQRPTNPPSDAVTPAPTAAIPASALDRRLQELLEAAAPMPYTASALAAAEAAAAQQAAAGCNAKPLGTPSASESALGVDTMLANVTDLTAPRDLLHQSMAPQHREQVKEIQRSWKLTSSKNLRTTHAVIFLCLQPGGDPPDHPRISPRAKLEGWIDPTEEHAKLVRGSEAVLDALESQYRAIHKDMTFRRSLECAVDDARQSLQQMRKKATDNARMLVHYNGHGMPPATAGGELWFYDKDKTHFMPLHISEIVTCADSPTIYVLDCNSAASVLAYWKTHPMPRSTQKDVFLCACSEEQRLPTNPVLPADFFTACLTTPLRAALLWYAHYSDRQPLLPSFDTSLLDQIPGDESNKRSPRGELAFILAAVADTVAWCTVEPLSFYALFRQDVLLKGLLRNFLLADRLMRETGCVPRSHPSLPYHAHLHPAWQTWDFALEGVLAQIPSLIHNPNLKYTPSPFWRDQLSSFEVGLAVTTTTSDGSAAVPEQLPCVVLALGQSAYRYRALLLLTRFFEQGTRAVHHGFACGIIGYVVRLLAHTDLIVLLLGIWLHMLRANLELACAELIRAMAEVHLINVLTLDPALVEVKEIRNTLEELPGPEPYYLVSTATTAPGISLGGNNHTEQAAHSLGEAAALGLHSPSVRAQRGMSASQTQGAAPAGVGMGSPMGSNLGASDPSSSPQAAPQQRREKFFAAPGMTLSKAKRIAAFILCAMIATGGERSAIACWNAKLVNAALAMTEAADDPEAVSWGCLLLSRLCEFLPQARDRLVLEMAYRHALFLPLLNARHPSIRASAISLLSKLLSCKVESFAGEDRDRAIHVITTILAALLPEANGISTESRVEVTIASFEFVHEHRNLPGLELGAIPSGEFTNREFEAVPGHGRAMVRSRLAAGHGIESGSGIGGSDALPIDGRVRLQCDPLTFVRQSAAAPTNATDAQPLQEPLSQAHKDQLRKLVHDASLICYQASTSVDMRVTSVAAAAHALLMEGRRPVSARIAREGHRLALSLDRETQHSVGDQERCSERRNEDLMRQSLLQGEETTALLLKTGKYEVAAPAVNAPPPTASSSLLVPEVPATSPTVRSPRVAAGGDFASADPSSRAAVPQLTGHVLRTFGAAHGDATIVAIGLRQLEPHALTVDNKRQAIVTNYESLKNPQVLQRFTIPECLGVVEHVMIINDLASSPLSLTVGRTGVVVAHRGLLSATTVQDAMTFNAAGAEVLPTGACVTAAYRNRDGTFFFGGVPNEVRCISLAQEMIEQTISVPGDDMVSSLFSTQSELLVGKDDGTVKIYDTRQSSRFLSLASSFGESSVSRESKFHPRVIHACRSDASPNDVFVGQRQHVKVYDIRKRAQPKRVIALGGANPGPGSMISAVGVSMHLPLMTVVLVDGTTFFLTTKGTQACDEVRVAGLPIPGLPTGGANPSAANVSSPNLSAGRAENMSLIGSTAGFASHALAVHPHRPIAVVRRDLIALTADETRLATSLAI